MLLGESLSVTELPFQPLGPETVLQTALSQLWSRDYAGSDSMGRMGEQKEEEQGRHPEEPAVCVVYWNPGKSSVTFRLSSE